MKLNKSSKAFASITPPANWNISSLSGNPGTKKIGSLLPDLIPRRPARTLHRQQSKRLPGADWFVRRPLWSALAY